MSPGPKPVEPCCNLIHGGLSAPAVTALSLYTFSCLSFIPLYPGAQNPSPGAGSFFAGCISRLLLFRHPFSLLYQLHNDVYPYLIASEGWDAFPEPKQRPCTPPYYLFLSGGQLAAGHQQKSSRRCPWVVQGRCRVPGNLRIEQRRQWESRAGSNPAAGAVLKLVAGLCRAVLLSSPPCSPKALRIWLAQSPAPSFLLLSRGELTAHMSSGQILGLEAAGASVSSGRGQPPGRPP